MAHGRRRAQRDSNEVANPIIDPLEVAAPSLMPSPITLSPADIIGITDNRLFNPEGAFSAPSFIGGSIVDSVPGSNPASVIPVGDVGHNAPGRLPGVTRFGFVDPQRVTECHRRQTRREVLFARKRTGKGGRARHRRRTPWSDVRC